MEKDLKKYLKEKDEFISLQDLKEAKKALNKIKTIVDNYFNNYIA